jgi:HD-like signal output (HDOD) protein
MQDADGGLPAEAILEAARTIGALNAGANAAPRILGVLCDPRVTAEDVARVVNHEPGLAGRVLRVANSAFYGLTRTVATIDRAVVVLGLDAVRGVAAAACLERALPQAADSTPLNPGALLRHSVATAAAAESLARVGHRELAGEAFIAGLLHDFGLMVLLRLDPAGVQGMLGALGAEPAAELRRLERQRVSVGHERCAAMVFTAWNLPASLVESVRQHHDPLGAPEAYRVLAALVHVADQLSLAAGFAFPLEPAPQPQPAIEVTADFLGLSDADLAAVAADLPARADKLRKALAAT